MFEKMKLFDQNAICLRRRVPQLQYSTEVCWSWL